MHMKSCTIKMLDPEKIEIKEKVNLMITDGIVLEIPIDTHITKLEQEMERFSDLTYVKKEKNMIKFLKALNNQNRIRILQLLKIGAKCSCELEYSLNLSQPTISHHITILENAHIVKITSKGKWKIIELIVEDPIVLTIIQRMIS